MSHPAMQAKSLESDVRYQLTEARIVLRRRSVIPLMVGQPSTAPLDAQAGSACETSMLKLTLTASPCAGGTRSGMGAAADWATWDES